MISIQALISPDIRELASEELLKTGVATKASEPQAYIQEAQSQRWILELMAAGEGKKDRARVDNMVTGEASLFVDIQTAEGEVRFFINPSGTPVVEALAILQREYRLEKIARLRDPSSLPEACRKYYGPETAGGVPPATSPSR